MESYLCAVVQIKKIDQLLVSSFVGPFIVTFFIALFVLVMQTLWLYIDEIAGKGVGFFLLVELLGYMSVSMIPLALPIAVLISKTMPIATACCHSRKNSDKTMPAASNATTGLRSCRTSSRNSDTGLGAVRRLGPTTRRRWAASASSRP